MTIENAAPWGHRKPRPLAKACIELLRKRIARGAAKAPLRSMLRHLGNEYDIEIDGVRLRCRMNDNYTEQMAIERDGHGNRQAIGLINAGLDAGDVFVDIGANCGLFTVFAARKVGPSGKVLAIEPIPEMVRRLKFNIAANNYTNVVVAETAVGESAGEIDIFVDATKYGHASASIHDGIPHRVPVTPLLDICRKAGVEAIAGIKIDIEGYEDRALIPFFETAPVSMWPRQIFIEIAQQSNWQRDLLAVLDGYGYRELWSSQSDVLLGR